MSKTKAETSESIPRILWSKYAYKRYDGPAIRGFRLGGGYINEALRIAVNPKGFQNVDVEKAVRILITTRHPKLVGQAAHCTHELEMRRQQPTRHEEVPNG
jgi:hypothetical protein